MKGYFFAFDVFYTENFLVIIYFLPASKRIREIQGGRKRVRTLQNDRVGGTIAKRGSCICLPNGPIFGKSAYHLVYSFSRAASNR